MTFPKKISPAHWLKHLKLAQPKIITFDAYNTLYCTTLPVMEQYSDEAKKCGINVTAQVLTESFPTIFSNIKEKYPNYGKSEGLNADEWWGILIRDIFEPHKVPKEMIQNILKRFEGKQAYAVYPDVLELLQFLKEQHPEVVIGIISNTDPKVYRLLENLDILKYFENFTYFSYDLELSKPDIKIFEYVLDDIIKKRPNLLDDKESLSSFKKKCWHVGDELKNDLQCAHKAGWSNVLIDRTNNHGYFEKDKFISSDVSEHDLSIQKVDQTMCKIWELCEHQDSGLQLDFTSFILPNLYTFRQLFFR
ncbi:similar to Saccharomyces cerevisiae YMR130W Putative protein of unknown function [Maudiozyma barnettii]|uniref:Uncharacterized protein n=1 Tax=Maudiozyma barnettii TaxID=61262 RepID=A0A8H2VF55_9SACH|nr:Dpi35p [Kazachstania barnettii]CAB4254464.1 similar to Saccharomyces cerevisiae YMR130W Putative protein of unknown function [Kazachstania barnettii]CAD1782439.1 similar to Saccharomyces cerevisiae YMR130W Putative protein of unknown function [Kazachstania barnettii]